MGSVCGKKDDAQPEKKDVEEPATTAVQDAGVQEKETEEKETVETTTKDPGFKLKTIEELWQTIAHYSASTEIPPEDEQSFNISELVAFLKMAQDVEGSLDDKEKFILERVCVHLRDEMKDGKSLSYREFWLIIMRILRTQFIKPIVISVAAAVEKDRNDALGFKTTNTFVASNFDEYFIVQELWSNVSGYTGTEKKDLNQQTFTIPELVAFIKIAKDIKEDLEENVQTFLERLCDDVSSNMKDCEAMNYVEFRMIVLSLLQKLHIQPLLKAISEAIEKDKKEALEFQFDWEGMDELVIKPRRESDIKLISVMKLWATISGYDMNDENVDITTQTLSMAELVAFLKMVEDIMSSLSKAQQRIVKMIRADLRDEMKTKTPMKWETFRTIILRLLKHHFIKPVTEVITEAIDKDRENLLGFKAQTAFAPDELDEFAEVQEMWHVIAGYRGDNGEPPVTKQTFKLSELVALLKIARDIHAQLQVESGVLLGWLCESLRYEMKANPVLCYAEFRAILLSLLQDLHIEPLIKGIDDAVKADQEATLNFVNEPEVPVPPAPEPIPEAENRELTAEAEKPEPEPIPEAENPEPTAEAENPEPEPIGEVAEAENPEPIAEPENPEPIVEPENPEPIAEAENSEPLAEAAVPDGQPEAKPEAETEGDVELSDKE